ncbi:MAG: peroxiredoxin 2/4 [Cyanobacteriota bacterium erpe_2018_sw_39hr_WHONDRS-SW48-000098_B_bin.30]|nr:peroxiredoxin 2/4 [Cyanobacteriota bacterium erpe_2018_sw_39hr_WHONDRS-SW48-000098_B_bin.30]
MTPRTHKAFGVFTDMLQVGKRAPDFDMPSTKDLKTLKDNVKLTDYKGKWLVLFFYPLDFTFVCPTELKAFSDAYDQFKKAGAEVLAISTDSVYSHRAWINTSESQGGLGPINYVLASDITKDVSRDFGVLMEDKGIALRGLFIIDQDGVLQYQVVHSLNIGRSVEETLRVLEALKTGGLCQADWKPGQKPMTV